MRTLSIAPLRPFRGTIRVPGDKSISHRALLLSAIAKGASSIVGLSLADDVQRTLKLIRALGVAIKEHPDCLEVMGEGTQGLHEPDDVIDLGNSGTSMRLGVGLLAACPFLSVLSGDESLRSRPMARVIEPLRRMGAKILARKEGRLAPIVIQGGALKGMEYVLPQASAQVKSALLLAGLHAKGTTRLKEGLKTRDHTERLLKAQGAPLLEEDGWLVVEGPSLPLRPFNTKIPGDFSSAAFFIVGALIKEGSELTIEDVGLNPLRTGMLGVLKRMGAKIEVATEKEGAKEDEPKGRVWVRHSPLMGTDILEEELPSLIDEIPALCVAAAFAKGKTRIFGAQELRVKETDRIKAMGLGLKELGVGVEELPDGLVISGGGPMLPGRVVDSFLDHRIAMAFAILGSSLPGGLKVSRPDCVVISYPGFWMDLAKFAEIR